jgi:trigger factor
MNVQVENLEKNMAKLTIELPPENLERAIQNAYTKQRGKINMPGFRKGKVPRHMIEKMYGTEVFFEDAANFLIGQEYPKAIEEAGVDIVSHPTIDVTQIEKGKPFIFTAEVAVKPTVKLGVYKGIHIVKRDILPTEAEIMEEIDKEREQNSRTITIEDRPIQDGDIAVIDFEGSVDGVPFDGGKAENHSLQIGSHSFIDTFEEQLIGKNSGDEAEVLVTFPAEYQSPDLAGKEAVFKVKIHEIKGKELPALDDEFAQDVSEFDTLDEYKDSVRSKLTESKENYTKQVKEEEAISKIIEMAEMEIPEPMIETQTQNMMDDFERRMSQQGLTMEQYLQFSGSTLETMEEQMRPNAEKRIKTSLVLEQIAKEEQITASEDDMAEEMAKLAKTYNMEVDQVKEMISDSQTEPMKQDIAIRKALDFVMEHAKEVEKQEE